MAIEFDSMKFLIGYKSHMTAVHRPGDGRVVPATVITVPPATVTTVKGERDGYVAVQVGSGRTKRATEPVTGRSKGLAPFRVIREFRPRQGQTLPDLAPGQPVAVDQFQVGDVVDVVGVSKGRGFQGVVKRHHFGGSPKTHGHKDQLRMPGSIGATAPQRVFKGMRMAGRMGHRRTTVKHLEVVAVDAVKSELVVKGAVPGAPRSLVLIQSVSS